MRRRVVMVGAGGWAGVWVREFLPALAPRVEVVALVDVDGEALRRGGDALRLPPERRFTDTAAALDADDVDACFVAIPPAARLPVVTEALTRGIPVLCEKPLASTWAGCLAIRELVDGTGGRLVVVQNYRFTRRMRTLVDLLERGEIGRRKSITIRFAADYTIETAGGAFRHAIPDAMLYEGAEHHLDALRHLTGADARWVSGVTWTTPWSTFANPACAMFLVGMRDGVVCQYEMDHLARGHQNAWHHEAYRVEGEHGAAVLDADGSVRMHEHLGAGRERVTEVPLLGDGPEGHVRQIGEFLDWLDGGRTPGTEVHDNIHTAALTFAAVEAARSGQVVGVPHPGDGGC